MSFSDDLTADHRANLEALHQHIRRMENHIPALESEQFSTTSSVHWTLAMARHSLEHWLL